MFYSSFIPKASQNPFCFNLLLKTATG